MAHDKYSTRNKQIWYKQKMVHYKNGPPFQKMSKGYICQGLNLVIFKRESNDHDSDSW